MSDEDAEEKKDKSKKKRPGYRWVPGFYDVRGHWEEEDERYDPMG